MVYKHIPNLVKGAFVEFVQGEHSREMNIISFQYNPETISRTLGVYSPPTRENPSSQGNAKSAAGNAQPFDPTESFTLNLSLDATDALEHLDLKAVVTGVAARIAALEMLLYPMKEEKPPELVKIPKHGLAPKQAKAKSKDKKQSKMGTVPIVLFVWGPGRILPVRLKSFQVDEQAFSPLLYPIRAKVSIGLQVLTRSDLSSYPDAFPRKLALSALSIARKQKLFASDLQNGRIRGKTKDPNSVNLKSLADLLYS